MSFKITEFIDDKTELKLIARGNTAEVYQYGDNKILKLLRENLPVEPIAAEYENVRRIRSKLDNIPEAHKIVGYKGRYGIVYDNIPGDDMIKVMLKNITGVKRYSKLLAGIHCDLHKAEPELNDSVKSKLSRDIDNVSVLSGEEKDRIKSYLLRLPEGGALLHFDFHPGNIIMRGDSPVIIDWMTACTGDPNADAARTWLLLQYGELNHAGRLVNKIAGVFKRYIGKIYIEEYKRLSGISDRDFEQWLLPVAAGRLMEWISDNEKRRLLRLVRQKLSELD